MTQLQQLYRLQQLDTTIQEKKKRLLEVYSAQKDSPELLVARQRMTSAEAKFTTYQTKQTDLNLEMGSLIDRAKRSEARLYSGKVTNPKELEDLQHEIEALGRRRQVIEEELLDVMMNVDDAQIERTTAEELFAKLEAVWNVTLAEYKQEQDALAIELKGMMQKRAVMAGRIDPPLLKQYEDLRIKKNGVAVSILRMNSCSACRISVSANVSKQVERGEMVTCAGCGRILTTP